MSCMPAWVPCSSPMGAALPCSVHHCNQVKLTAQVMILYSVYDSFGSCSQAACNLLCSAVGGSAAWGRLDKHSLESCIGVVALALSVVMAGTGHLPTFKLLRGDIMTRSLVHGT